MGQMNISNLLWNDTKSGTIAYSEQVKDRSLDYSKYNKITQEIKTRFNLDDKFQSKLNDFFLYHYDEFHRFLEDEGVDPTIIDSWKEVQDFLEGLPDDETTWLKNKLTQLDNRITAMDIPDGGAYDISADHVDGGGNYAKYSSLSEALNAITTDKQKPGMTVRFIQEFRPAEYTVVKTEGVTTQPTGTEIQSDPGIISGTYTAGELSVFSTLPATLNSSLTYYLTVTETVDEQEVTTYTTWVITYVQSSDNKYVQYRYMETDATTAATFTNVANWQGVDDEPTVNSDNLVKSGGVAGYSQKSFYSNTGMFNKLFKEFYAVNINIGAVTSIYIDKAKTRTNVYRTGITLCAGSTEIFSIVADRQTTEEAVAYFKDKEINVFTKNDKTLYFIIDWSLLDVNTRTTFDVSLTNATTLLDANPSIKAKIEKEVTDSKLYDKYQYKGIANISTNPGTPTSKELYIATTAGTYTNFGNLIVPEGLNILKYDGTNWTFDQVLLTANEVITNNNSLVKSGAVASYAQKSILSNTGQFNQLFKEFYISGHSFDVTTVTSMYIDKAKYRNSKYRNGITLKVGNTEVLSGVKDFDTQAEANNAIKSNEVNKLTGSNGNISFIIDWDALNSNTRTEFNVLLTKNVESIDLNPSIKLERYQIDSAITPDSNKLAVSGDVAKYAKRALLSNNGQFNKLFSEFYLTGNSFDISSVTSLYIDKAKYRSGIERYRTGITLLAGETEVFSHHVDFETAEAAVNYFANKNIVKLIDNTNTDTILYVVIDWDSLNSNTRTTINVSLNATAVTRYDCNPFIGSVLLLEPQPTSINGLFGITVGNNNVHDFDSEYPSRDVNADLASWKDLLTTFLNRDFLTIVEWTDNFDNAGNVNTYNTLLKQFYPYYHTTAVKGLFSKLPCEFEEIVIRFTHIVAKTNIGGKSLAVVCWHHTNTATPAIRRASYRELISYLADFDLAIISGDFNNDDGAEELSEFTDAGYVLGNNGYWGQIDTCTTSTSPTFAAIDNIITKGFIYDSFEKSEVKVQTDHYPVRAKLTLTV